MNPYPEQDDPRFADTDPFAEPERTSLAAILGFICSLGGCIGGVTAVLGVPVSIFGLINIGRSRGRLGGKAFAIAGLLIGLLNLALWGGCLAAITFVTDAGLSRFAQPTARALESLQTDQFDAARANLASPAADASDAEMAAFLASYRSTLGDFQSLPSDTIEYISQIMKLGPIMNSASGRQNTFPVPATFQSGPALLLIGFDPGSGTVGSLTIIDTQGNEYELPMPAGWEESQTAAPDPTEEQPENPDGP
ncbi:MAG: hypothetical protein D6693_06975 [Planctomycetota bacterium]|nr:MAG: hypothetical protein D6693_06975 [Planctomycetota bacterium]